MLGCKIGLDTGGLGSSSSEDADEETAETGLFARLRDWADRTGSWKFHKDELDRVNVNNASRRNV